MHNKMKWMVLIVIGLMIMVLSGCNKTTTQSPSSSQTPARTGSQEPAAREATLYFADDQALYLVPEKHSIQVDNNNDVQKLAEAVVKELIAGPRQSDLLRTIPKESRLLSIKIDQGVATVDFSQEFQTKNPGGSTGETMAVYSVVYSLTELPGIKKVQLLIDGQKKDTLVGHLDISQPLTRDPGLIKK